jgi:hypothetical protein
VAKKNQASVPGRSPSRAVLPLVLAGLVYAAAAAVLFNPLSKYLHSPEILIPFNSVLAATGCFLLSRRWTPSPDGAFISGLLYGFGPYLLSFVNVHPLAGFGAAMVPWLFCPAALWHKYETGTFGRTVLRKALLTLPLPVLFLFFWLPTQPFIGPYFLMPRGLAISPARLMALTGVFDPGAGDILTGFYSAALILSLLGTAMFVQTARISVFVPVLAGLVLTFWGPLDGINPVVWFSVPAVFLAITAGVGGDTATLFGPADRRWILAGLAAAGILTAWAVWGACRNRGLYLYPAMLFALTAAALALCLFLAQLPFRTVLLRKLLIDALVIYNIYIGSHLLLR